jgi:hypothetical protein
VVSRTQLEIYSGVEGELKKICGAFRHRECVRFSSSGELFPNLTCSVCARIPHKMDFRMRVVREDRSLVKRGSRCIGLGR